MHLGILNMPHLIVSQVGIKIETSIRGKMSQPRCQQKKAIESEKLSDLYQKHCLFCKEVFVDLQLATYSDDAGSK